MRLGDQKAELSKSACAWDATRIKALLNLAGRVAVFSNYLLRFLAGSQSVGGADEDDAKAVFCYTC
jgi:hypothetical protein